MDTFGSNLSRMIFTGTDLSLVHDYPATAIVEARSETLNEIEHDGAWHERNAHCERPHCRYKRLTSYTLRHLARLERPGRDAGVAPIAQDLREWNDTLSDTHPGVSVYNLVDMSGGDYMPLFERALSPGPAHVLTGVLITSGGDDTKSKGSPGGRWAKLSRSALISNLVVRFERKQVKMDPETFKLLWPELRQMHREVTAARNLVYKADKHDDLIIALALACWYEPDSGMVTYGPDIWDMEGAEW